MKTVSIRFFIVLSLLVIGLDRTAAQSQFGSFALHFDGTTNATVVATNVQGFPLENITVEFWARSTNTTKAGSVFSYGADGNPNRFLIIDQRNLMIWLNNSPSASSGISINDGAWHHIAITWSTNGALLFYKDGALAFSTTHAAGNVLGGVGTLVLGQDQDIIGGGFDPNQAFEGDLDEVRLWSVVRSDAEIAQNWTNALTGTEPGLVSYYRFNEGVGATVGDLVTSKNNGTTGAGVAFLPLLSYNAGTALDLSSGNVQVPDDPAFNGFPFTFSAWLRTSTAQTTAILAERFTSLNGFFVTLDQGKLQADYLRSPLNSVRLDSSTSTNGGTINDGLWHHVAFTVDSSGGSLFVDGILKAARPWQGNPGGLSTVAPLLIGQTGGLGFNGQVDEVSLWNLALSANSVQTNMNRRLNGSENGMIALYHFDEGSGLLVQDSSPAQRHGVITNNALWVASGARIAGLGQISGRVTSLGSGLMNTPVTAVLPPVIAAPQVSIPDNGSVTVTNNVTREGTIGSLKVSVNIVHPYRGDLELTLIHPDGSEVRLKDSDGADGVENLVTSYPDLTMPAESLAVLSGKPTAGAWRLRVLDHFAVDTGVLNSWSLQFGTPTVLTDSNGFYTLSNLSVGNYTVAPSRDGFVFNPTSRLSALDQTNVDFTLVSGFVSGRVTDPRNGGAGVEGVRVTAGTQSALSDVTGNYRVEGIVPGSWNGSVTASLPGYLFPGFVFLVLGADSVHFSPYAYPIAGRIVDLETNGVAGVVVNSSASFGSATTDSQGNYLLTASTGTNLVIPAKSGVTFSPSNRTVFAGPAVSNVNFIAAQSPPTITHIPNQVIPKNGTTGPLRFDVNDTETRPALLQVSATSSDTNLIPNANVILGGVGSQRTVAVTPATNQTGTSALTLTVTDESGLSLSTSFSVRVNQLPLPGIGRALNFDGINNYAGIGSGVTLDKGDYTVEAWAFSPSNSGPRTILSQGGGMTIGIDAAGQIRASTNWNTGVAWPFGNWHHVALVRETNDTRLYLDGTLKASRGSALELPSTISPFQVGTVLLSEYWLGAIDEVRVWRVARTASQVASNMLVRVTGNEPNLGGLWRFDELSGSLAVDTSPNAHPLTINGATRVQSPLLFDPYVTLLGRDITDVLQGSDPDGDALTFSLISAPTRGTVSILNSNTGAFVYTADGVGDDQFTFSVNDGFFNSEAHAVNIRIEPDTNAPLISFVADQTIPEDTLLGPLPFTVSDGERAVEALPVFGVSSNLVLVPNENINISGTGTNRTFSIRPATNQFGQATITLIVSDGSQQSTSSFVLTVTPVNDPPLLQPMTNQVVARGGHINQPILASDVDTPVGSLIYAVSSSNATLVTAFLVTCYEGTNSFPCSSIIGSSQQSGLTTVTATASDTSSSSSVTFQVRVNSPPTIAPIPNQSTFRDIPTGPIAITLDDVDDPVDNAVLTATSSNPAVVDDSGFSFTGSGSNRTLVVTPVGGRAGQTTITVTARDDYQSTSQSFQLFVDGTVNYEVIALPHLPGADRSMALGLNENGQIVGWSAIGTSARAVVWDVRGITPTVTPLFNSSSVAISINNKGEITGRNFNQGFYYFNGVVTSLANVFGPRCAPVINEGGDIVGGNASGNVLAYFSGPDLTFLTNAFYPNSFAGEQLNLALNDRGDVFGLDTSLTHALVWRLNSDGTRTLLDQGQFSGVAYPLVAGINNVGQVCINSDSANPVIRNYQSGTTSTDLQAALSLTFPGIASLARDMNDSGEVVGGSSGITPAFLYTDGRAYRLADLMRSSGFAPAEARAINAYGDVVGYGNGVTGFLLRRRWYVGQPQVPPLAAINPATSNVFQTPIVKALDGTPDSQVAQAYLWSDFEQRLFFKRPMEAEVTWFTSSNPVDPNSPPIVRRGRVVWPVAPQMHIAGAPADSRPIELNSPYRPVSVAYTEFGAATLDASTWTFNNPNPGYSVIHYLLAPEVPLGGAPNPLNHSNYFEVVRTVAWNDPAFVYPAQPAIVGSKVTDPRGPVVATNSFKTGWTIFPLAPYDGAGTDRAYDRLTQTGPIIPVNRDTAAANDDLVVAFYKKSGQTSALWPDLAVPFSISWPTDAQKLVIADSTGSGPLPEAQYPDKRIYFQSSTNLPGYNPNEEHAFLAPTSSGEGVFALRNDLNRPNTSANYVLLKYRNPTNSEWQFKLFQTVLTDPTHIFTFNGEAGQEILPPYPLSLFTICDGTTNISGQVFRDFKGKYYATRGPTPTDLNPQVVMRYYYPLQPSFYYDLDGNGTNDLPVGECVRWDGIAPGTATAKPIDVTYRIRWPDDAPTLQIGETLLEPKRGLPAVKDWASAQVVFDSLNPDGATPLTNTARLYDPLTPRVLRLTNVTGITASYQFPPEIALQTVDGKQIFTGLPFHLRSRLSYDPANKALSFAGFLDDTVLGEPLLMVNVLSKRESERIKQLSGSSDFQKIIEALYNLTRNPNGVNIAHPGGSPDQALLIGFTTKYTVWVTNGTGASATINIQEFYGARPKGNNFRFVSTNIVLEPFGDAPKALTAGLPVPESHPEFGRALNFNGIDNFVPLPPELFDFPISGTNNTPFTFECWFKTANSGAILGQQFGNPPQNLQGGYVPAIYVGDDGKLRVEMFWKGVGSPIISASPVNDGTYHHLAVVYDGLIQSAYLDGTLMGSASHVQTSYASSYSYQLGAAYTVGWPSANNGWLYFNGQLDEVRLWNKARGTNDLILTKNIPLTGGEPGLIGYWRFDEASGPTMYDSSTASHDLTSQISRVQSSIPATGSAPRYVVIAENNNPALGALPVTLHVIRVDDGPFRGDLKTIFPDNVFDERLTLRHSSDFGADPDRLEFEWWYHPDNADFDPTELPTLRADGSIDNPKGWLIYTPALNPTKFGQNTITIGDSGETSQFTLADNWFISRYRGYNIGGQTNWSDWVGDPASAETPRASLAPGWVKRVIEGLNPFEARTTNFHDNAASTYASMLIQAGQRFEGNIAFNPSGDNVLNIGLIEAYTTVLNRGKSLSIDGLPPVDSDPLNNALLLAASRISDLYMLLGNEAFADAQDPTIGLLSDDPELGSLATSSFAFKNQLGSLLEEELALLRGRDDSASGVGARPVYNRLLWNFTGSEGEVAYERTYNIGDVNLDGVIDEKDAQILFPQGHGDAWGHYLTAITTYYDLLRHPRFTWVPRTESVLVAGTAVRVDFLDERKFAAAAAAKAKAGSEIVDLTYRSRYVDDPEGQYQGYKDTREDRAWGVTEWARRAGQGAYFDWLVGNSILPSVDPNTNHVGIQKIDRQTVQELDQIIAEHKQVQSQLDKSDIGLNPLGLAKGALLFDLDPTFLLVGSTAQIGTRAVQGLGHFSQIYERTLRSLKNCFTVWDQANLLSEALRRQQDTVDEFTANVADQERDFKSRLIEVFGYPYSGDIGPGKTFPSGYDGPDLYHYMYVNATELTGAASTPTNIVNGFFSPFADGTNAPGYYFSDTLSAGNFSPGPVLNVQFPLAQGSWAFTAPASFGSRRAPGELQLALSDLLQEETRLKIALGNYDAHIKNIRDAATLLQSRKELGSRIVSLLSNNKQSLQDLDSQIKTAQDSQIRLHRAASIINEIAAGIVESIPDSSDPLGMFGAVAKGVVLTVGLITSQALEGAADVQEIAENDAERSKEQTQLQTDLDIETATQDYEIKQQAAELLAMMRDESTLRLEAFNQVEIVKQASGRYQAALAAGERLLSERIAFRQRTAGATQQNRYKDMAFRIFRNEAIQKYRAQFDLTARYVFLCASVYDYELNFLGTDNRSGRDFFTDIIRQRSLGQMIDGEPVPGRPGLADPLGRLRQNFDVLAPRFGLNTPQLDTARFSLRKELFRIKDDSDEQWRAVLRQAVVPDLWQIPEFRRHCRPFAPENAGPQPGIVLRFPTTITSGLNFFGFPLGGGDSAYDPSLFSTKINSVGIWFENYNSAGLALAPRIYLMPLGMDVLRAPTGNTLATREWRIVEQAIPTPFPIGAAALADDSWIPANDSLAESFAEIRRFASFRAYHDDGVWEDTQTTFDTRLVGRSVWNTDWLLIIPGATLLFDPNQGLDTFINSIGDIKISLQSYSYSGN